MSFTNVSTRQKALMNEENIASITSDVAAMSTTVSSLSAALRMIYLMEGEGVAPIFSCSGIPFDAEFGIPMVQGGTIYKLQYICSTGSPLTTQSMTLTVEVWTGSTLTSTADFVFTGNVDSNGSTIAVTEGDSVVVKYASSFGTFPTDARFRLAMVVVTPL
jgi:hypothetical protein